MAGTPGILPRTICETCGRKIAMVAAGLPRSHRFNGDPCPGSGNMSGTCGVCGRVAPLERNGTLRPHKELRVRRSQNRCPDGLLVAVPETYSSKRDCPGAGELPEVEDVPMPVEPMNAERWPSARELAAERFDLPTDVPHNGAGEPVRKLHESQ